MVRNGNTRIYFVECFMYLNFTFANLKGKKMFIFLAKIGKSGHNDHALHSVSELSALKNKDVTNSLATNDV